jgi:hypothetical protein
MVNPQHMLLAEGIGFVATERLLALLALRLPVLLALLLKQASVGMYSSVSPSPFNL